MLEHQAALARTDVELTRCPSRALESRVYFCEQRLTLMNHKVNSKCAEVALLSEPLAHCDGRGFDLADG